MRKKLAVLAVAVALLVPLGAETALAALPADGGTPPKGDYPVPDMNGPRPV